MLRTKEPGMLQSMESKRIGQDLIAQEQLVRMKYQFHKTFINRIIRLFQSVKLKSTWS